MEQPSSATPPRASSPAAAAEQARLRKERREAKIKAGGSARLGKITSMGGRPSLETHSSSVPGPGPGPAQSIPQSDAAEDPAEVDISRHFFAGAGAGAGAGAAAQARPGASDAPRMRNDEDEQLRRMLAGFDAAQFPGAGLSAGGGHARSQQEEGDDQEPMMMRLLQQVMMGAGGGGDGSSGAQPGFPPALAQMLGQGAAGPAFTRSEGGGAGGQVQAEGYQSAYYLWRIIHFISALALALYAISTTTTSSFTRNFAQRIDPSSSSSSSSPVANHYPPSPPRPPPRNIFWIFTTLQLLLQSTRFFLSHPSSSSPSSNNTTTSSFLQGVAQFLPPPWNSRLLLALRYARILATLLADALLVVFVWGVAAWWSSSIVVSAGPGP